jgi:hypothetical protein
MKCETTITPPNSIILVMDFTAGRVPDSFERGLIAATETCVAVGTLSEQDGSTTIVLTDEFSSDLISDEVLVYENSIRVPGSALSVVTSWNEPVLSVPVLADQVYIRVWVNHPSEPNRIVIVAQ